MNKQIVYVLDTHILIWYFLGSNRLKKEIKELIDKVRVNGGRLLIPTIVLAESLYIAEKRKVTFDFQKMYQIIREEPEFEIIGFSREIFEATMSIENIPDIHDRIIVATAHFYNAGIMTKDRVINTFLSKS